MSRTRRSGRWTIAAAVLAVLVVALVRGLSNAQNDQTSTTGQADTARSASPIPRTTPSPSSRASAVCRPTTKPAAARTVQAAFAQIPICPTDTSHDYRRDEFGTAWTDDNTTLWGRNGCDTRSDLLRRDLINKRYTHAPNTTSERCKPVAGDLPDPYTGHTITYRPGPSIQADHVISLHRAWQTGAQHLTEQQRVNLANDPLNLLIVDGHTNQSKSDNVGWLPPHKAFRCRYLALQIAVTTKYQLWHTRTEHRMIATQLRNCPTTPLPTEPGGHGR